MLKAIDHLNKLWKATALMTFPLLMTSCHIRRVDKQEVESGAERKSNEARIEQALQRQAYLQHIDDSVMRLPEVVAEIAKENAREKAISDSMCKYYPDTTRHLSQKPF